ncbi:PEP-CTERM sorting domain-containing protein [bacterium]|nr:MAG: PEP-CTERM sorting domain-containing protein [bacterium]
MKSFTFSLLATLGALSGVAAAAPTIWSGNDHAYEVITLGTNAGSYAAAKSAAEAMTFRGVAGQLAVLDTAGYAGEFGFVSNLVRTSSTATMYWVGASHAPAAGSNLEGWRWEDGTTVPTSITNGWNIDEAEGSFSTVDYGGIFYSADNYGNIWDYAKNNPGNFSGGYVVEFASPEPATLAALGLGTAALLRRRRKG